MKNLILYIIGLLSFGGMAAPSCQAAPPSTGNWQLIWSDEFDSGSTASAPNPSNWSYESGYVRNKEWQYYTSSLQNAYCKNGYLHIEAHKHPAGTYPRGSYTGQDGSISSASLKSRNKVQHQYGWLEMRARIDTRLGSWPAFWTLGSSGEWPDNGECDIMEYYKGDLRFNVAWWKTGDARWTARWDGVPIAISGLPSDWNQKFHVWSMEWTPPQVKLYMDGVLYNTWDSSQDSGDNSIQGFQQPHYIILNQAIGAAGGDASGLAFPTRYEIDWVRWYQDMSEPETLANDNDSAISYTGTWGTWQGNPGYRADEHYSQVTGSTAAFAFTGTRVRYFGFKRSDLGHAEIYLDGRLVDAVDCYSAAAQYFYPLYESPELPLGPHTLAVKVKGTKNPASSGTEVIIDAFGYFMQPGDTTPPASPVNLSATACQGKVLLNWNDNSEPDFSTYRIYRSTVPGGDPVFLDTASASYYIDDPVEAHTHYYTVSSVDAVGNESPPGLEQRAPRYRGDLTFDGHVNLADLTVLAGRWLSELDHSIFAEIAQDWLRTDGLCSEGTVYYVDSNSGSDAGSGTSPQQAWASLEKVNGWVFQPGDRVLFKAGTQYSGRLKPKGNGTAGNPIRADMFGTGPKPLIDGSGWQAAVLLEGIEYWHISNLKIINNKTSPLQPEAQTSRYGVYLCAFETGPRNHLYLKNLYIRDIFAETSTSGTGIGIGIESDGDVVRTHYNDILVENCRIENTAASGIWLHHKNWWKPSPLFAYNTNIVIRNNILENIGGPGIQPNHCKQMLIEYNTIESGQTGPGQKGRGSGFWNWNCEDITLQYNILKHARGEGDSCGAHVDIGNINTLIQYNLSYDNAGGFVEILGDSYNTVYRYNISINDGWRVKGQEGADQNGHMLWLGGWTGQGNPSRGPFNSHIYHNTIYLASGLNTRILIDDSAKDAWFRNNIFYSEGTVYDENPDSTAVNINFENNLYSVALPVTLPVDSNAIVADPQLVSPGGTSPSDYKLSIGSPAINAGMALPENGGQDYWGNLITGTPDLGAHEKELE